MSSSFYRYRTLTATKRDHEQRYRYLPTAHLFDEREGRQWELAKIMADLERDQESWAHPAETVSYALTALEDINSELDRRQRLRFAQGSPEWPKENPQQLEAMKSLANEMKQLWSVEDFCRQILSMPLQRQGSHLVWTCPVPDHHEATASFKISPEKNVWYCHGCNRGGDLFTLIGYSQGLDRFSEQLEWLTNISGQLMTKEIRHAG